MSAISQRAGPSERARSPDRECPAGCDAAGHRPPLEPCRRSDGEGVSVRFVEGDREVVRARRPRQPASRRLRRTGLASSCDVGRGRGAARSGPQEVMPIGPAPGNWSLPWPPSSASRPHRRRGGGRSPGRRRSRWRRHAADQGVGEGRAFQALEAEAVGRDRRRRRVWALSDAQTPRSRPPPPTAVANEAMSPLRRARRPCGRSRSRRGPRLRCRGHR